VIGCGFLSPPWIDFVSPVETTGATSSGRLGIMTWGWNRVATSSSGLNIADALVRVSYTYYPSISGTTGQVELNSSYKKPVIQPSIGQRFWGRRANT
jgi:hypothetical protein